MVSESETIETTPRNIYTDLVIRWHGVKTQMLDWRAFDNTYIETKHLPNYLERSWM